VNPASPGSAVVGSGYSADYYAARHVDVGFQFEVRSMMSLLPASQDGRVLEIGCGGGALLDALQKAGRDPFGLDINHAALKLARRVAPAAHLAIGGASALPYGPSSFRAVLAQHVVEHFERSLALLAEWGRVLVPGGTIVLVTPNTNYPDHACFFDPTHRHIYSRPELERLLEASGFEVQQSATFRPHLNLPFKYRLAAQFARVLRYIPWFREAGAVIIVSAKKRVPSA
jgi:ubiquinone/menaquinone biosynthesis C-methylase UbiE